MLKEERSNFKKKKVRALNWECRDFFCYCHKCLVIHFVLWFLFLCVCDFSSGTTSHGKTTHKWWCAFFCLLSSALFYTPSAEIITAFYQDGVENLIYKLWRGCKCLITNTTNSLVWSCGCRHFVDAKTLSTAKTLTKMLKMIRRVHSECFWPFSQVCTVNGCDHFPRCAQSMVVTIFPGMHSQWLWSFSQVCTVNGCDHFPRCAQSMVVTIFPAKIMDECKLWHHDKDVESQKYQSVSWLSGHCKRL